MNISIFGNQFSKMLHLDLLKQLPWLGPNNVFI